MIRIDKKVQPGKSVFQKIGIVAALLFYATSIVYVNFFGKAGTPLDLETKTLTLAHWGLEDGVREGYQDMIDSFEALKGHEFEKLIRLFENRLAHDFKRLVVEYMQRDPSKGENDFRKDLRNFTMNFEPTYAVSLAVVEQTKAQYLGEKPELDTSVFDDNAVKEYSRIMDFVERIKSQRLAEEFVEQVFSYDETRLRQYKWTQQMIEYAKANTKSEKVKIIQSTVPFRMYNQWFITQLIGQKPADVMMPKGFGTIVPEYYVPLASYVGKPNPYNIGTPVEGYDWKDTFIDGLETSLDPTYADYFTVGTTFSTYRLFVNLDLLQQATGSKKTPTDLTEWMETCAKIKDYSKRTGKLIIPIGCRGISRQTLRYLFSTYFSQINGHLNDIADRHFGKGTDRGGESAVMLEMLRTDPQARQRMLAAIDIMQEIGQYFADGFTAMDMEQSKFQFFANKMVFLPSGSFNGYTMIRNSRAEVGIISLPPVGYKHRYSKYYTGKITESGQMVGGGFGIPKATKHFDIALELLRYMTSYEMNQMVMARAKWLPAVRFAKYEGLLKKFAPDMQGNRLVGLPFTAGSVGTRTANQNMLEWLEAVIVDKVENPQEFFYEKFTKKNNLLIYRDEYIVYRDRFMRAKVDSEKRRTQLSLLWNMENLEESRKQKLPLQRSLSDETFGDRVIEQYFTHETNVLEKFLEDK